MKKIFFSLITFIAISANCLAQSDILNLAYGNHAQQTLDLFLPKNFDETTPVIIMIHGGAWIMGGKEYTDKTSKDLRNLGFIVANIDYRYVSESVHSEDLLQDVDNAVSYVQKEGKKHGYNTKQVHMAGISAGGHLSLLYGYTTKRIVKSINAICPPTALDEVEMINHLKNVKLDSVVELLADAKYKPEGMQDEKFTLVSPCHRITRIPTLLIHGDNDHLVPYEQSSSLYMFLQERNVRSRLVTMKGKDHDAGMNDPITEKQALNAITQWVNTYN
jgi:acetyl esterase/lipase